MQIGEGTMNQLVFTMRGCTCVYIEPNDGEDTGYIVVPSNLPTAFLFYDEAASCIAEAQWQKHMA